MKINVFQIVKFLDDSGVPAADRAVVLSICLARAVGYGLDMPTSKVESPQSYYISNLKSLADSVVSQVNENIALNFDATCKLIESFWTFRYRLVYDMGNMAARNFLDGLVKVGSREFPGYVADFLIKLPEDFIMDKIAAIIRDGVKEG